MTSFLSLIPPSYIVAPLRDIGNKLLLISTTTNSYSNMTLPSNMRMDIDDFVSRNVDNYDDMRDCTITSDKTTFKTVSMFLSKILVNYTTRMEWLNNISDEDNIRDPSDSLQLSYAKTKKV